MLQGLLSDYSTPGTWYQVGTATPDDAADVFTKIYETFGVDMATTGVIVPFAGGILPSGWLPCDGRSLLITDYPNLFGVIGNVWGSVDASHFNIPDLRGQTLVGTGTAAGTGTVYPLAGSGGEEAHTLTVAETPAHSHVDAGHTHAYASAAANATTIGPGAPQPTAVPFPSVTGSGNASIQNTGGSGSHENRQPFKVVNYAIIT